MRYFRRVNNKRIAQIQDSTKLRKYGQVGCLNVYIILLGGASKKSENNDVWAVRGCSIIAAQLMVYLSMDE